MERAWVNARIIPDWYSLMQRGAKAGEMAEMTGRRVDGGEERAASPEL